ncbi:MAG TPA: FrgA protein, partial [Myxococcaceae bacterium]|nr:FrgA protein [Myxococcaceae bacterium]
MPAQLVQVLLAQGLLPQDKAEDALRHQTVSGGLVDTALLERRLLSEPEVLEALGDAAGLRPVNLADFEPNADVASFIPPKIAERLCVVPLSLDGNTLHVACGYPVPKKELEEVGFLLGKPLELWVGIEARVREWISIIYEQPLAPRYKELLAELEAERQEEPLALDEPLEESEQPEAPPAPSEEALTVDMVERLAQSVASEPVPQEVKRTEPATTPVPPPAYTREPLRLNMPAEPPPQRAQPPPPAPRPPAPRPPAPQPPARDEVPEWTLAQARAALKESTKDRDRLIDTALRFGRRTFDYVAAFAVLRGAAVGLEARGEGMGDDELSKVSIPLDAASVFRTVAVTRGSYA